MVLKKPTSKLGALAEDFAVSLLKEKGYRVVERNFRSRFGEIDIVALKDECLIFVEVKARWSLKFGLPEESVTPGKIWKIGKTGEYYSILHPDLPKKLRIDVVALQIVGSNIVSSKIITID